MTCSFCPQPARYRLDKGVVIALFCLAHMELSLVVAGFAETDFISLPEGNIAQT